jgi:hypothetical protein
MPSPAVTGVSIGSVLESVTSQRVDHLILDFLNRRRKIGDKMVRIRIETDNHSVGKELGDFFVAAVSFENLIVNAGQEVLIESADGFGGVKNGARDAGFVEFDEGTIAFLDFDDAVLDWH